MAHQKSDAGGGGAAVVGAAQGGVRDLAKPAPEKCRCHTKVLEKTSAAAFRLGTAEDKPNAWKDRCQGLSRSCASTCLRQSSDAVLLTQHPAGAFARPHRDFIPKLPHFANVSPLLTTPRLMPRLVARQWHILHPASATIGVFRRPQWPSTRALVALSRRTMSDDKTFKYTVSDKTTSKQIVPQNSAIIIPASIPNTQPADVISLIKPVPTALLAIDPFCVILVTPSFAPWLLKDDIFLRKVLSKAYTNLRTPPNRPAPKIHALCAVVNKLPSGRAFAPGSSWEDEALKRTRESLVGETGFEGIAYTMLPVTASVPSAKRLLDDQGALDFVLDEPTYQQTIRVPLANTIFQTGTSTTMSYSVWQPSHEAEPLALISKSRVSHHGIRLAARGSAAYDIVHAFNVPLLPLTLPRRIVGCLGNIIRQLNSGIDNRVVTASSELEETVPNFFRSRGESTQATTVWALVIPATLSEGMKDRTERMLTQDRGGKEMETLSKTGRWEKLWQKNPSNVLISVAIAGGARLHRVLSGGGGWGKKAGLLSLDPVPSENATKSNSADPFGDPQDLASALTPVAQMGDFIQFFISVPPETSANANPSSGLERLMGLHKENTWGLELGTIPSTIDSAPGDSWQTTTDSEEIVVFRNTFGALAEGGLMVTRRPVNKEGMPSSTSTMTSLVDVPFSRLWAVELKDTIDASERRPVHEPKRRMFYGGESLQRRFYVPQLQISPIVSFHGNAITGMPPDSTQEPLLRKIMSEDPTLNRFTRNELWLTFSKRARGIEGVIRRCKRQVGQSTDLLERLWEQQRKRIREEWYVVRDERAAKKALERLSEDRVERALKKLRKPLDFRAARQHLEQIEVDLRKLTKRYRIIMRTILERNDRDLTILDRIRAVTTSVDISTLIVEDEKRLMRTFPHIASSPIENEVWSISINMKAVQTELANLLQWIGQHAHIMHRANRSALRIYGLDIALRCELRRMIRHRLPHKVKFQSEINHLESRIMLLRDYRNNLMCNRPGLDEKQVKKYLHTKELRNLIPQRLRRRMNETKKRLKKEPEASSSFSRTKVRKTFAGPLVRAQVTKRPLIRRRATTHPRRQNVVARKQSSLISASRHMYISRFQVNRTVIRPPQRVGELGRGVSRNRTSRENMDESSIQAAKERAKTMRRENLASRVASWLRGAMNESDNNISATARPDPDNTAGVRIFGMETSTYEDAKKDKKNDSLSHLMAEAVRGETRNKHDARREKPIDSLDRFRAEATRGDNANTKSRQKNDSVPLSRQLAKPMEGTLSIWPSAEAPYNPAYRPLPKPHGKTVKPERRWNRRPFDIRIN